MMRGVNMSRRIENRRHFAMIVCPVFAAVIALLLGSCIELGKNNDLDEKMEKENGIIVNGILVKEGDSIMIIDNHINIPLVSTLNAIGALVETEDDPARMCFEYSGTEYVCEINAPNPSYPEREHIYIGSVEYSGSIHSTDYILLNPMGYSGGFFRVNEIVYLYQDTGLRLLEALGCEVVIDIERGTLSIRT